MADFAKVAPELAAHYERLVQESVDNAKPLTRVEARERAERVFPQNWGENDPIDRLFDHYIESHDQQLKLRIYQPETSDGTILFLHGGGWVNGSVTTHDGCCIMLANQSNMTIVSINYRKAPEHKFPAGLNDGLAALDWLVGQDLGLNADNIMVCGESSGGNLAAVVARHARDKNIKLNGQILIYPLTDLHLQAESFKAFADGYMLSTAVLEACLQDYIPSGIDRNDPDLSPLLAEDLSGICPAFVATCDHDPCRDDGRAYAAKLIAAGVDVEYTEMRGALHGIWIMRSITPLAADLINRAADWVKQRNSRH